MAKTSNYENNMRIRIGLDTRKISLIDRIKICNLGFDYNITDDENYIYFTIMESFKVFLDLIQIVGHDYTKYLKVLIFDNKLYKTSTCFKPVYTYVNDKLTFTFLTFPEYYIREDRYLSLGELEWFDANDVDPDHKMYGKISEYLLNLCYADVITDEDTIKSIVNLNFPF